MPKRLDRVVLRVFPVRRCCGEAWTVEPVERNTNIRSSSLVPLFSAILCALCGERC